MGYPSTIRGEITFDPPLTWAELSARRVDPNGLFLLRVTTDEEQTPEGTLTRKSSNVIEARWVDQVKAYSAAADLKGLVAGLPDRQFAGEFRIEGEEAGDVRRVFVDGQGRVVEWKARLAWPDSTFDDECSS